MRRALLALLTIAVATVVVIGLNQASDGPKKETLAPFDIDRALSDLDGAPAPLADLAAQHGALLDGGVAAYEKRLAALEGHPVVVNKWGSWCNPCRQEFPYFQRAAADLGTRVAFLGINVTDNVDEAQRFLRETPITFPSYRDPRGTLSQAAGAPGGSPITIFIDEDGETAFVHQGQYRTLADLRADIKRYLRV